MGLAACTFERSAADHPPLARQPVLVKVTNKH